MNLVTLNKLTSSGNIQTWTISVIKPSDIVIEFGQKGGKIQRSVEHIKEGKNIGKSNETTPYAQACNEAQSRWNKKKDSGYFEEGHLSGTELISPTSLLPMLAQSYDKHAKKIVYPAYIQPKLDGCRMVASRIADQVILLSRKGKEFKVLPHINKELEQFFPDENGTLAFDGELYSHGENFQDIISKIKRDDVHPDALDIKFHIYDIFQPALSDWTYQQRLDRLNALEPLISQSKHLTLVETLEVKDSGELLTNHAKWVVTGYEGAMIRNKAGYYVNDKRSYDLQKVKTFQTEEFEIVGAEENRGRQAGQCTLICKTTYGDEFGVKPEGTAEQREDYWTAFQAGKLTGKMLTVKFFEYTKDNIPRFPIGIIIRDYEG